MMAAKNHIKNPQDPAGVLKLQMKYERALFKRFNEIEKKITAAIVQQDCFGLSNEITVMQTPLPTFREFNFSTNTQKVTAFIEWLNKLINEKLLYLAVGGDIGNVNEFWGNVYIMEAYKKGTNDIRFDLRQQGVYDFKDIDAVFNNPIHLERIGTVFLRNYEQLKAISNDMSKLISQVLAEGLMVGDNPRVIAKTLLEVIEKKGIGNIDLIDKLGRFIPSKRRAEILARTEIIRAHIEGAVAECIRMGYKEGQIFAEYIAGYDDRVCDECSRLHLQVFTLEEIRGLIPMHPQCRCTFVPIVK